MASDGDRERSLSRSGRSSVDSEASRSTRSDDRHSNRHLDRKLDKLLDGFADFRDDIKAEFSGVHRDIQEIQQEQLSFEGALGRLACRLDAVERCSVPLGDADLCSERRRQQRAGTEREHASAPAATESATAPIPTREPL